MKVELVHPSVFLDISIADSAVGRIVIELFDDTAPLAVQNFITLAESSFHKTTFHKVIKNLMVQAGDIHTTVAPFQDENLVDVNAPFLVCMANSGPNTNTTQFFITLKPQPQLSGKHTVFGRVSHGKSVVRAMEDVNTDSGHTPPDLERIVITNSGLWSEGDDVPIYNACYDPIGGDIYEEHPDDDDHINKESSESVYLASCKIKESGGLLFKKGDKKLAFLKYKKCLRYVMEYIPDQDQEPDWFAKYDDLKRKLYLNVSLVCLQLKDFRKCIDYCDFLIDLKDQLSQQELTKTYYRKGCALAELKQYKEGLGFLSLAKLLMPGDAAIASEYAKTEKLIEQQKQLEKKKYAKFFG